MWDVRGRNGGVAGSAVLLAAGVARRSRTNDGTRAGHTGVAAGNVSRTEGSRDKLGVFRVVFEPALMNAHNQSFFPCRLSNSSRIASCASSTSISC